MYVIPDRLRVVARHYFLANAFLQDEVINPDDSLEVLRRYLTAGDNDNFAWMLIKMTGWTGIRMTWEIPSAADGYHSLARAPNGRYLDIHGWSDTAQLRQRFFLRPGVTPVLTEARLQSTFPSHAGQDLIPGMGCLAEVIRNLPYEPFNTPEFQLMTNVPLKGADPTLEGPLDEEIAHRSVAAAIESAEKFSGKAIPVEKIIEPALTCHVDDGKERGTFERELVEGSMQTCGVRSGYGRS